MIYIPLKLLVRRLFVHVCQSKNWSNSVRDFFKIRGVKQNKVVFSSCECEELKYAIISLPRHTELKHIKKSIGKYKAEFKGLSQGWSIYNHNT